MILCIDCGNTFIKVGIYDKELISSFSIDTNQNRSSFQYKALFSSMINESFKITGAIISSVVPSLNEVLSSAIGNLFSIKPLFISKEIKTKLPIKIDNPSELGSDLLCGAVGAKKKYGYPLMVADLGTASKIYVLNKDGAYIGGIITSGMKISLKALVKNTSLLMEVPLETPKKIVGKNTTDSIQSGIVYGQAYMISEFARRIEKEIGYEVKRVLTGGFSSIVKDEVVCFNYEPTLVLDGLYEIYLMNVKRD